MISYSYVRMKVDGRVTSELDIYREHNVFHVFEHDENEYSGSYTGAVEFINTWKEKKQDLVNFLKAQGFTVVFEQTIK